MSKNYQPWKFSNSLSPSISTKQDLENYILNQINSNSGYEVWVDRGETGGE